MAASRGTSGGGVPELSIAFPYYDNPQMLKFQLEYYKRLPESVRARIEIIVVDDASPEYPAEAVVPKDYPISLSVFRIALDKPWNQDAARNIGAREARSEKLLLTDIDHIVPQHTIQGLLEVSSMDAVLTFPRKAHFSDAQKPPHVNSYFMSKEMFWSVGGYDEDYWGTYGSDWIFRRQLQRVHPIEVREDLTLELVTQGSIADAKNKKFSRSPSLLRRLRGLTLRFAKALGLMPSPRVLVNPYQRVR